MIIPAVSREFIWPHLVGVSFTPHTFFTGTQLTFSRFSFWLWLLVLNWTYSHTTLCLRSQNLFHIDSLSWHWMHVLFCFCLLSSPISQKVLSLDLILPQSSSPRFDFETHYYELNRSVLKVPSLSRYILKSFWYGAYHEKHE